MQKLNQFNQLHRQEKLALIERYGKNDSLLKSDLLKVLISAAADNGRLDVVDEVSQSFESSKSLIQASDLFDPIEFSTSKNHESSTKVPTITLQSASTLPKSSSLIDLSQVHQKEDNALQHAKP